MAILILFQLIPYYSSVLCISPTISFGILDLTQAGSGYYPGVLGITRIFEPDEFLLITRLGVVAPLSGVRTFIPLRKISSSSPAWSGFSTGIVKLVSRDPIDFNVSRIAFSTLLAPSVSRFLS